MVVEVNPPYKHLVQKRSFCGPACIQMVLFRNGLWVDQEELAYELGVVTAEEYKDYFIHPFQTVPKGDPRYGFKFEDFDNQKTIDILSKYDITSEVLVMSEIGDVKIFLIEQIQNRNDIIACFRLDPFTGEKVGHYVLVAAIDDENDMITFCDPHLKHKKTWTTSLEELMDAMETNWDGKERGFIIIKNNTAP